MATLTKRGNVYHGRHIYYENGVRREKHKTFRTMDQRDAYRRLAEWEKELQAETFGETYSLAFEEAAQRWLNEQVSGLALNTRGRYETSLKHLRPFFKGRRMNSITQADLSKFEARRRRDPGNKYAVAGQKHVRARKDNGHAKVVEARDYVPVASTTIKRDLDCLSSFMTFAVHRGWAGSNPVRQYLKERRSALKSGEARMRYLSRPEEARLLAAAAIRHPRTSDYEHRMFIAALIVAIDSGLRLDEQMRLEWQNMQMGRRPCIREICGKGNKTRSVPLLPRVANVVASMPVSQGGRYLFGHEDGRRRGDFSKALAEACKRAGIENFTWHDLRRTCGCRLLQDRNFSMVQVRDWLGHSSVSVTEKHYAFLRIEDLHAAVERSEGSKPDTGGQVLPLRRNVPS